MHFAQNKTREENISCCALSLVLISAGMDGGGKTPRQKNQHSGSAMVMANINSLLPAELLERVFGLVPPLDRRAVLLVCRRWREVGEVPGLWAWVLLRTDMPEVVSTRRLGAVRALTAGAVSEDLLQAVLRHRGLRRLELPNINVSAVRPELLGRLVGRLEDVNLFHTFLTRDQATAIFTVISQNSKLKRLNIGNNKLSSIEPALLAEAVSNLEEVSFQQRMLNSHQPTSIFMSLSGRAALTSHQIGAVFAVAGRGTNLRHLNLVGNNLSSVEPGHLAQVVSQLEVMNLYDTSLTGQQVEAVIQALVRPSSTLKRLNMGCNNLSMVAPRLLARAVARLEAATVLTASLTTQQTEAILRQSLGQTKLQSLGLDLVDIDSQLVSQACRVIPKLHSSDFAMWLNCYCSLL